MNERYTDDAFSTGYKLQIALVPNIGATAILHLAGICGREEGAL